MNETVTHRCINRARRRVTELIGANHYHQVKRLFVVCDKQVTEPVGFVGQKDLLVGVIDVDGWPVPGRTSHTPRQHVTCSQEVTWFAANSSHVTNGRVAVVLDPHYVRTVRLNSFDKHKQYRAPKLVSTKTSHDAVQTTIQYTSLLAVRIVTLYTFRWISGNITMALSA